MENRLLKLCFIFSGGMIAVLIPAFALSYSPYYTHPDLTEQIARLTNRWPQATSQHISEDNIQQLRQGAIDEDSPPRWINHFYDPTHHTGWRGRHFGAVDPNVAYQITDSMAPIDALPSVDWATNQAAQTQYKQGGNQTWQKAVRSYLAGNDREAFSALGHVLHLLEDASVPEHTRGDTHVHLFGDPGSPYEEYAQWFTNTHSLSYATTITANTLPSYANLREAFDAVALYSQQHFFSEDTISNDEFAAPAIANLERVVTQVAGKSRRYLYDPKENIFLAIINDVGELSLKDQAKVLPSYRERLFPKAIRTGAAVVNLFFQEVKANENGTLITPAILKPSLLASFMNSINTSFFGSGLTAVVNIEAVYSKYEADTQRAVFVQQQVDANKVNLLSTPLNMALPVPKFASLAPTGTISTVSKSAPAGMAVAPSTGASYDYSPSVLGVRAPDTARTPLQGSLNSPATIPPPSKQPSPIIPTVATVPTLSDQEKSAVEAAIASARALLNAAGAGGAGAAAEAVALSIALMALGYALRPKAAGAGVVDGGVATWEVVKQIAKTSTEQVVGEITAFAPAPVVVAKPAVSPPPPNGPSIPPSLYKWVDKVYGDRYAMVVGGVWHDIVGWDNQRVANLFGANIPGAGRGSYSGGWSAEHGGGTVGRDMALNDLWGMQHDVLYGGLAPTPELYARGFTSQFGKGSAEQNAEIQAFNQGVANYHYFAPQLMFNPADGVIYTVNQALTMRFSNELGFQNIGADTPRDKVSLAVFATPEDFRANRPSEDYQPLFPDAAPAPTAFQKYFEEQKAKGKSSLEILQNNPFMAQGTRPGESKAGASATAFASFNLPLNNKLSAAQKNSIFHMLQTRANENGVLNTTDAKNLAFALGKPNDWQQFTGLSAAIAVQQAQPPAPKMVFKI